MMNNECASVECAKIAGRHDLLNVNCSGFCNKRFHRKCVQLAESDVELIIKNKRIKFLCDECATKYDQIKNDYKKLFNNLELQKNAIDNVAVKLDSVIDYMKDLKESGHVKESKNDFKSKPLSYAETVKLPLFIKPKDNKKNQLSSVTKQEIKNAVKPAALSMEIDSIKELNGNNGVVINCASEKSAIQMKNELIDKIGNEYEVIIPKFENPKILVAGLSDNIDTDAVVKAIEAQNSYVFKELKCHKVYESFKRKGFYNAIIEVDGVSFNDILKSGKLNIEWDRCAVYEHCRLLRCHKCHGFNHTANKCTVGVCCYKCGDKEHLIKECPSDEQSCLNCVRVKNNLGLTNLDVSHATKSEHCPLYKRLLKRKQNKILY